MTTQFGVQPQEAEREPRLLRRTLRANALVSTVNGIACLIGAGFLASLIGIGSPVPIFVLGLGLLVFALIVFNVSTQHPINRRTIHLIFIGDVVWVVASVIVLVFDPFAFTTAGRWLVVATGDIVLGFAILEGVGLYRSR